MQRLILAVATAITIGAGVAGYYGAPQPKPVLPPAVSAPATAMTQTARPQPAPATPAGKEVSPTSTAIAVEAEAIPPGELRYRRTLVETGADSAEACLIFSAALDASGVTRYTDYISLPQGVRPVIRVDGSRLCLSGLRFGAEYTLDLKAGLPGAKGEKLAEGAAIPVSFGDRPASVALGSGFILPRETADGLPVTTVNVDTLAIKVIRIGDRLLSQMRSELIDERTAWSYAISEFENDTGRLVWKGTMPVKGPRNTAVTSLFPLSEVIGKAEPGAYIVLAANAAQDKGDDDEDYYGSRKVMQWVVQSDLGITTFAGADGLTLTVRSLGSAKPAAGVRLTLIARNNDELGTVTTDAEGKAQFSAGLMRGEGGIHPVMVMAYGPDGDFTFLDLRRPAFDLSDRGVDGRDPSGPVDAFLYTDRGIYRPGETVQLVTLLRDPDVQALEGRSAVIKVMRPDGKEYRRYTISDQGRGGSHLSVPLPASASRGLWEAVATVDPDGPAVGRVSFDVQDFVPQRLGLTIGDRPAVLRPGDALSIPVEARFLYGAVASALGGEGDLTLEPDPNPYPRHKGFRWGLPDEPFEGGTTDLSVTETDEAGRTAITGTVPQAITSTRPLRADIRVAIREPGGRPTADHIFLPVALRPFSIGIRPHFDGSVGEGQDAAFDVITVNETGDPVAVPSLKYKVLRDRSTWQWFRRDNRWMYERIEREQEIASGTLSVGTDAPAILKQAVQWGGYRLLISDEASGAVTSVRFTGGWYGISEADRPDRLKVAISSPAHAVGETVRLRIDSDFAGEAQVVIANEKVQEARTVSVPAGGAEIPVVLKKEWGAGAYALVTLYRPLTTKNDHAPVRAVGVAWLGLDPAQRTLTVSITAPDRITPRQTLTVPVKITGGDKAFVTLAAVDQGILQLTRFKSPSPADHYLSKRRLGVDMRDDYGRLIRNEAAQSQDQGGDGFGGKGLDVVPTRTVALFSGVVAAGPDGIATIPLDVPDFQGELRLMAVAFDADKVGSADTRLTVRDPVVAEVILPRFLAPGDKGRATVLLHNVDGTGGDYHAILKGSGAVSGLSEDRTLPLPTGKREVFTIPLTGGDSGIGGVSLAVSGPGGFSVERSWPIQIRPAQLPETIQTTVALSPGQTETLTAALLKDMMPGTASAAVSLSRWQGLDVPGLLRWLDRYPFGCLEQTTSRALPLLYFNDIALLTGTRQDQSIDNRIQTAIDRLVSMQQPDGAFSMWGGWASDADEWVSVFALDFLNRAAEKGFDVPPATLSSGRRWMQTGIRSDRPDAQFYAATVLARGGQTDISALRYRHDSAPPKSPVALADLGLALEAAGDRARATSAFDQARRALAERTRVETLMKTGKRLDSLSADQRAMLTPYGSPLRDTYAVAAKLAAAGRGTQVPAVLAAATAFDSRPDHTTTQEKAWMLLTAAEIAKNSGKLSVSLNGTPVSGGDPVSVPVQPGQLTAGLSITNTGENVVYQVVSVEGVPATPLPALEQGLTLSKAFYTLSGEPVDPATLRGNDRVVVVLSGESPGKVDGDYAILDLLPAGWEIEGALRPGQTSYPWLPEVTEAAIREARDDRFVTALSLPAYSTVTDEDGYTSVDEDSATYAFTAAYVVRAVTPGTFTLPAATVEHMYKPTLKARTAPSTVVIAE